MSDSFSTVLLKIVVAGLLGGLIGLERDIHGRPAGLRTHILVSIGSALFMIVSLHIYDKYSGMSADSILKIDPGRIAAQIITGIGFLGAGAIMKSGVNIKGLTTAGSIWVSAGVGMASGISFYMPAFVTTAVALVTLIFLSKLERMYLKDLYRQLRVKTDNRANVIDDIISQIEKCGISIDNYEYTKNIEGNLTELLFTVRVPQRKMNDEKFHCFVDDLEKNVGGIKSIGWEINRLS
jgi:putative Mg2+ transporter-C (MgtC) family protein